MSKKCANCGAVIDDNAKVCPECNAELIERPNTIGMPISYELACREAEKGVKWAKFLAYGFFLFSGILSLV
ncbi:MAG: zinc ribbon domain-containing protein, partial [Butyrivibrio sp.]|nr:zinc ribbon domain-containing protein [Butyrivibrio sp.]